MLILDEATANLDYSTESDIGVALLQRRDRRTTLVIAHRFSMVENADHVVVMDAGRVEEQGSVEELIAQGGWFARFAASAHGAEATAPEEDAEEGVDEDEDEDVEDRKTTPRKTRSHGRDRYEADT